MVSSQHSQGKGEEKPKPTGFKEPERWDWIVLEKNRTSVGVEDQGPIGCPKSSQQL